MSLTKYPVLMIRQSFHEATTSVMQSNGWDYEYALGYVSGKYDAEDKRQREHRTSENDDYAKGYHRGYADGQMALHNYPQPHERHSQPEKLKAIFDSQH